MWDAAQYLRFGDERSRPFFDLTGRVNIDEPGYVVDLGCGPGNLTASLARRWPGAEVVGVDTSPEMIAAARAEVAGQEPVRPASGPVSPERAVASLSFHVADIRDWAPARAPDVIVCNAVLQWVPGHDDLLVRWAGQLAPGGWLAFQLPGNFDSPSHVIVKDLAESPRWRGLLAEAELNRQAGDPGHYVELLAGDGYEIDAWETTYLHVLPGDNPVVEWTKGTTLRPVLALLDEEQAEEFTAEYSRRVRDAYHHGSFGTIFPFRRVFAVVRRRD
jgi:trans-aconitate 2-methyltransferase